MKILCVLSGLTQGGAEKVMVDLAQRWSLNHQVHLLTFYSQSMDFFAVDTNVTRHSLGTTRRRKIWNLPAQFGIIRGIKKITDAVEPHIVVSFVLKTNIYVQLAVGGKSCPVILCEHSIIDRPDISALLNYLRDSLYPKASLIGVLTADEKKALIHRHSKIDPESVVVLPNPVHPVPVASKNRIEFWKSIEHINPKLFIAVSLGRLVAVKGFHRLFFQDSSTIEGLQLVVFGQGEQAQLFANRSAEEKYKGRIFFPGPISKVCDALRNADVFFSLSDFEGFGLGIAEAMSCGLPVVAFDVPGVRELVIHGETGLLVDHGDISAFFAALQTLMKDCELRRRLGANAKKRIIRYSPETVDKIWCTEVFDRVVAI